MLYNADIMLMDFNIKLMQIKRIYYDIHIFLYTFSSIVSTLIRRIELTILIPRLIRRLKYIQKMYIFRTQCENWFKII